MKKVFHYTAAAYGFDEDTITFISESANKIYLAAQEFSKEFIKNF